MQVAPYAGIPALQPRTPIASSSANAEDSTALENKRTAIEQASVAVLHFYEKSELSVREIKNISPWGLRAVAYIAGSSRLSKEEKRTLIRLVAIVDEFAGGNPKLMRDIIGIAKIMEMNATQAYSRTSPREALRIYFEEREKLKPSEEVTISVETEINAVSVQYLGITTEMAAQKAEAISSTA